MSRPIARTQRPRRAAKLDEAISRLAALIPYGELMASTDPAGFIDAVRVELATACSAAGNEPTSSSDRVRSAAAQDGATVPICAWSTPCARPAAGTTRADRKGCAREKGKPTPIDGAPKI